MAKTEWEKMREEAQKLEEKELLHHASVAMLERPDYCNQCFCCACLDVWKERQRKRVRK